MLALTGAAAVLGSNMNGRYVVASVDKQGVPFNDDYASKGHEYFDVWSPEIATTYGQNFWTSMGDHPLPDHIIKRFDGKVIAITGYEQDQVLVDPVGHPGVNPDRDVSVPINWAYNHHYMAWMTGKDAQMVERKAVPGDTSNHGAPTVWEAVDLPRARLRATPEAPTSLMFSEGNGGESRKSFHGYPSKFAQLLGSPTTWRITPMQIDTRRRDCGVTRESVHNCTKFEPWLEPRQARYGRHVTKTNYSGILECPCNSRYGGDPIFYPDAQTKKVTHSYSILPGGTCATKALSSAERCFEAGLTLGLPPQARLLNSTVDDASEPAGCFVKPFANGTYAVTFNQKSESKKACASGTARFGGARSVVGVALNVTLDPAAAPGGLATLTISGPAGAWFGVGLNAQVMADSPYTIICNASGAFEQQIGTCGSEAEHCAGDRLSPQSLTLVSNTVSDGVRTVVVSRPFAGASSHHLSFDPTKLTSLNFITAIGSSEPFGYHKAHAPSALSLLAPVGNTTCLCDAGTTGQLCHTNGTQCAAPFTKNCYAPWDGKSTDSGGDLLATKNPTCDSAQYAGGLTCCGHMRVLLDADQDPGPTLLRYHMKFRFWFQEYTPGAPKPGEYKWRPGALPGGYDVRPPATMTVDQGMEACAATKGCVGITFASNERKAGGTPVTINFKNGSWDTNGAADHQSWVVAREGTSHHHLPRFYYQTEASAGEYDIPPAFRRQGDPPIVGYPDLPVSTPGDLHLTPGTTCTGSCPDGDDCECIHTITFHWTMTNARMLYAGGHCHAPSCIGIALYRNDTGTPELICHQTSRYGQGDVKGDRFDEAGYVVLPPCLWGAEDEGLAPPNWVGPNTPMFSVKRNHNTHAGHFGEMASWQMRGVNFDGPW